MRSLSDTIARLTRVRQIVPPVSPEHNRLIPIGEFGSNPGNLNGHFFIPTVLPPDAPLVVVLHGCLQTAAGYDHGSGWSKLADEQGFALLFPEQQRANNPNLCFNWFRPQDIRTGSGEAHSIRQMIDEMTLQHGLNRNRIFITGLSAGGAMAGVMLAAYPDLFAGGGIIAGLPYGSATSVPAAFDRMRGHGIPSTQELARLVADATPHKGPWPKISVWHGDADRTVAPANGVAIVDQWRRVHGLPVTPTSVRAVGPHTHRSWSDAQGQILLEQYVISGLDHGTPLDVQPGGYGAAGPHMIDAGISSTQRVASFWGLTDAVPDKAEKPGLHRAAGHAQVHVPKVEINPERVARSIHDRPDQTSATFSPGADRVRKVIEDALRTAGLLK